MENIIICPSCGAVNTQYGKCEYCGSEIKPLAIDSDGGKVAHGIHKIDIDERVLWQKYDQFKDVTITRYKEKTISLGSLSSHYSNGDIRDYYPIAFFHYQQGWQQDGKIICNINITINVDGKNYEVKKNYPIDKGTLFALCTCTARNIRIHLPDDGWSNWHVENDVRLNSLILVARLYYFTFFDNTQFQELANDISEKKKKKEATEKKESEGSNGCIGRLLFLLGLIGFLLFLLIC